MGNACTSVPTPTEDSSKSNPPVVTVENSSASIPVVKSSSAAVTNVEAGAKETPIPDTITTNIPTIDLQLSVQSSVPPNVAMHSSAAITSHPSASVSAAANPGNDSSASSESRTSSTSLDSYSLRLPFSFLSLGTRLKRAALVCKLWSQLAKLPPLRSGSGNRDEVSEQQRWHTPFAETYTGASLYYPPLCGCSEEEIGERLLKHMMSLPSGGASVCCLRLRYGFSLVDYSKLRFPWAQMAMSFQTLQGLTIHLSQTHFPIFLVRMLEGIQFPPQLRRLEVHFGSPEGHSALSTQEDVIVMGEILTAAASLRALQHLSLQLVYPDNQSPRLVPDVNRFLAALEQHGSAIKSLRLIGMVLAGNVASSLQLLGSLTHLTILCPTTFPLLPASLNSLELLPNGNESQIPTLVSQELPRNLTWLRSVRCQSLEHVQLLNKALPSLSNLFVEIPPDSLSPISAASLLSSLSQCAFLTSLVLLDVKFEGAFSWSRMMTALPHLSSLCLKKISPPIEDVAPLLEPGRLQKLTLFDTVKDDVFEVALASRCKGFDQLRALAFGDRNRERLEAVRRLLDPRDSSIVVDASFSSSSSSTSAAPSRPAISPGIAGSEAESSARHTSRLARLSSLRLEEFSGPHLFDGSSEERLVQLLWERGNPFPSQLLGIEKEHEPYDIDSDPLYNNLWCK